MFRALQSVMGVLAIVVAIALPILFAVRQERETRNFRIVREGVLYRSAQMSLPGLKRILHDYGIRTIVTLRDTHDPGLSPPDLAEEQYCIAQEINYLRLPPFAWEDSAKPNGPAPVQKNVDEFLKVMRDPRNFPVLVHCFAGVHRTGAYTALYRMEFERWTHAEALAEMRACGYTTLDDEWDILGFMERFRPSWMEPTPRTSPKAGQSPAGN